MKRVYEFFSSTSLTVILSALIAAVAAAGSFFCNGESGVLPRAGLRDASSVARCGRGRDISELHSGYILIVLIALFAINTSVCTFDRLYSIIKMKRP